MSIQGEVHNAVLLASELSNTVGRGIDEARHLYFDITVNGAEVGASHLAALADRLDPDAVAAARTRLLLAAQGLVRARRCGTCARRHDEHGMSF